MSKYLRKFDRIWQNPHLENAGKFTSEFLMLANFGLAKFTSREFK